MILFSFVIFIVIFFALELFQKSHLLISELNSNQFHIENDTLNRITLIETFVGISVLNSLRKYSRLFSNSDHLECVAEHLVHDLRSLHIRRNLSSRFFHPAKYSVNTFTSTAAFF